MCSSDLFFFNSLPGTDIGNVIAGGAQPGKQSDIRGHMTGSPSAGKYDMFHEIFLLGVIWMIIDPKESVVYTRQMVIR